MDMIQATRTHQICAQEQWLDTRRRLRDATQWGYHKTIRRMYVIKYEIEAWDMIRYILH